MRIDSTEAIVGPDTRTECTRRGRHRGVPQHPIDARGETGRGEPALVEPFRADAELFSPQNV